ncbi:uncharacterized protein SCHCODRAFT_02640441 [Schizophyllum commune H4-8]|uniref:uncharacterized protein n=1 Tax=Schizophyllum commune (strain H4-8 / FGSC 9210) TaxID=578458 RepID=UPI002160AB22|nr:uncharacterized protein SCHCODRAFT_02640441 [Schizophyllum commune H4-8]KAI5886984.1 hypothetical protein SCHCODRAFT_02640441 [Schizophyllum commune H4-8]
MIHLRFAALALLGSVVRGVPAVVEDRAPTPFKHLAATEHDASNATIQHTPRAQISANYVFTAFTDQSESNLYVYTSSDAVNFDLLAGPTYTPASGLIRDPSVVYWNDQYYLACKCITDSSCRLSLIVDGAYVDGGVQL